MPFVERFVIPISIVFVGAIVGGVSALVSWGIKRYIKDMDDKLVSYNATITQSFLEIKSDFAELNKRVRGVEGQLANLTSSNQEVSFRVSGLNDKFDTQTLEFNRDIKKIFEDYSILRIQVEKNSQHLNQVIGYHQQHHKDDRFIG